MILLLMKLTRLFPLLIIITLIILPSCFNDEKDKDYSAWREENTIAFQDSAMLLDDAGKLVYTEITPDWDKSFTILMRWHNTREENTNLVNPLSNSTCHVKYTLTNIAGDTLDSSSSFTCVPNQMVTGFMAALTNMVVNDTVTAVLPYTAGYGAYGYGNVYPFSTLVFGIRLDSISKLM